MSSRQIVASAVLLCCSLVMAGCETDRPTGPTPGKTQPASPGGNTATARSYPYRIATTCSMVTDIVRTVAGERGEVKGLMGEGVDPHLYKPTRNDARQLLSADIIFYSGLMLEGRMADTFIRVARSGKTVYAVTEEIDESYLREPPEFDGHWDPHVWMDVRAWSKCTEFVATALSDFDPPGAEEYKKNSDAYVARLDELDKYARKVIATIPEDRRVLVTAHDAFGYFSMVYNIQVKSVLGSTTESDAGIKDINNLVDFIVDHKIAAVFAESSVNNKGIQAVIAGAKKRGWQVQIGGTLYSDAMGAPDTYEGTYIGMIDHNATVIARALGGQAPERGLNGRLAAGGQSSK